MDTPWPTQAQLAREADRDAREAAAELDMRLVRPIFGMIRESLAELRKIGGMIHEPQCAKSADLLDEWAAQELGEITSAVTKSHEG